MPRVRAWLLIVLCAVVASSARAQEFADREYRAKAGLLRHLGHYVTWPDNAIQNADGKFIIGIFGKDFFGRHLVDLAKLTVGGKRIVVRRISRADEYKSCHLLFIAGSGNGSAPDDGTRARLKAALAKVNGTNTLLVGETQGFEKKGVAVNLPVQDNRVRIIINPDAAKRYGLKVDPRLLRVATIVRNGQDKE